MANQNLSQFGEKLFVADSDHTFIWDSAVSISKRVSRNSWLNSGTLTSDAPVTISQTWNAGSNVMTALKLSVIDTTSGSTSSLLSLDLSTDNVLGAGNKWRFEVKKTGLLRTTNNIELGIGLASTAALLMGNGFYSFGGGNGINLNSGILGYILQHGATQLWRGSADHILEQRNGAAAQTFNVYGTSSASNANYARLALTCGLDGNATISTQALGTGTAGTVSINGVPVGLGKGNLSTNVAIGTNSLSSNTSGDFNSSVGYGALSANTGGLWNSAFGASVLTNNTGSYNSSFGVLSLFSNVGGSYNSAFGLSAGRFIAGGATANTVTNNSIYIGALTKASASGETNQIVIGYDATGIGSNSVVLGNDSITKTALKGNVGIGTTSPTSKLHVDGNALFGQNTTSPTLTPIKVSFGGTYGTSTAGSRANLKWEMYNDGIAANTYGIGMSVGVMEFQAGAAGGFNFYPNNTTVSALSIASSGAATFAANVFLGGYLQAGATQAIGFNGRSYLKSPSDGVITLVNTAETNFNRLQLGGTADTFPALKRSTTRIQAVLATTDTTFTNIQGKLTTDTDYTAGSISPTGFLTLYDAQGNAYKVPCVAA